MIEFKCDKSQLIMGSETRKYAPEYCARRPYFECIAHYSDELIGWWWWWCWWREQKEKVPTHQHTVAQVDRTITQVRENNNGKRPADQCDLSLITTITHHHSKVVSLTGRMGMTPGSTINLRMTFSTFLLYF